MSQFILKYSRLSCLIILSFLFTEISYGKSVQAYDKIGNASWYGAKHQGLPTATGARFRMNQLTAASRDLPIGTYVKVTYLKNNKSVIVKITDKGPFAGNRIIDLSHAAAKKIGIIKAGVARVRVRVVTQ